MRGIEEARKLVTTVLAGGMPDKLAELTIRYGLQPPAPEGQPDQPDTLPGVRLFASGERQGLPLASTPAVLTTRLATIGFRQVDIEGGRVLYRASYRLRTYVYARGINFDDTADKVDRYTLAVRELILVNLNMRPNPEVDTGASVDPGSITESYSGVEAEDEARSIGGAYVEYALTLEELADRTHPAPGVDDPAFIPPATLTVLPAHPALG